jgi:phage tail sheath protein FI
LTYLTTGGGHRVDRVLADQSDLVVVTPGAGGTPSLPATNPKDTNTKPGTTTLPADPTQGVQFTNGADGPTLSPSDFTGDQSKLSGIFALDKADLFNLLCIPNDVRDTTLDASIWAAAATYCANRRAMLIVDPPFEWGENREKAASNAAKGLGTLGLVGDQARNAALYFPCVVMPDPNWNNQANTFVPCGIVAGVMAQTDVRRGVWKAPAGLEAALGGISALQVSLNDAENGQLNPLGINCLRNFRVAGPVVWGARTARGADQLADEYKYVPVRRLALYMEESLYRGTQWVVFEPNDEPLWAQIRLNVGAFMQNLFRQGAFQGKSPTDAYFVKCDNETTIQNDIDLGIVNIVVGFAPLKPAEFVIIKIQQMAGQIQV